MSASPWSHLDLDEAAALLTGTTYVQNELVVALQESSPTFADVLSIESARNEAFAGAVTGVTQLAAASVGNPALYHLTLSTDADFTATLSAISNWTTVEWVQPNFVAAASAGPEANSAPLLTTSPTMTLGTILEDDVTNNGTLITALLATGAGGDPISDADAADPAGIAITSASTSNGTWQFSTNDGADWVNLGTVSTSNARLLAADAQTRIRFRPNANVSGTLTSVLSFKAWDQSTGVNGGQASASSSGGGSAFSSSTASANIAITGVNDAPSFTKGADLAWAATSGARTITGWATSISPGPNESQLLTFEVTGDNPGLFAVQPAVSSTGTLTFTPIAGVTGTANMSVRLLDNGGTANGGIDASAVQTFRITINAAPTVTTIADQTIMEDATLDVFFSVADADTPSSSLVVGHSTINETLAPTAGRVITALGGGDYRLTLTPAANLSGSAPITVSVSDGTTSVTRTFALNVTALNDAPSFVKGSNQSTTSDGLPRTIINWASSILPGADETAQTFSFLVSNDSNGLFAVQPAISSAGVLTYTPAAGASGTATVTVRLQDSGGTAGGGVDTTAPQTFTITLAAAPVITPLADQTILEDAATTEILFSVSDADSPLSSLVVNTSSTDSTLTPSSGRVLTNLGGGNYRLVITPAANRFGTATITVNVFDGTSTASRTFLLTVKPVNDAPTFTAGGGHGGRADGTAVSTTWTPSVSQGSNETGQNLTFLVSHDNPSLFAVQPSISQAGTLTYTFQNGATGSALVRVRLQDDGGTADGGVDTSVEQTFVIRVTEPPTITSISNRTINEEGYVRILFTVADADGPLAGLTVTHSGTGTVVPTGSRILTDLGGGNYELICVPTPDASGTSTITVRVSDGYATTSTSFTLTVTAVNDAPSFVKGADLFASLGLQTVNNWATAISPGASESSQTVTFVVTNDNPSIFTVQPSISSTGALTYQRTNTPPLGEPLSAVVTVQLTDNGGTANGGVDTSPVQTFRIFWMEAFTSVPPYALATNEETPSFWDLTVPDDDTPDERLTAFVSAKNDAIFLPGSLTFTHLAGDVWRLTAAPAPNAFGTATIYIDMTDDRGVTYQSQLSITVGAVNDAPSFIAGSNLVFSSGADTRTVAGWATAISAGPSESQTLSFVVSNDNPGLFSVAPAINATGDLTFTQLAGTTGTSVVTVYLTDSGGTAAGGVNTSATRTFTIILSSPPAIQSISDITLNEDGSTTVDVFVDDPDTAPADLTLSAVSADGLLLPPGRATFAYVAGNHWRMTLAPAADRFGSSTVTLTAAQGSSAGSTSFLLTVQPQNDPPIFAISQGSLSVLPDADAVRAGWVSGIAGGPNETGQNTTWLITVDDPSLFAVAPTIDAAGTLRFRGAGLVGTARVTLRLRDDAGGADTSPPQVFEIRFTDQAVPSGSLDPTFNADGRQTLPTPLGAGGFARDTAVQADGKMIVVGVVSTGSSGATAKSFVMRLNVDGSLDTTFGDGGVARIYNPGSSTSFQMQSVELTDDGKIVVAGESGGGIYVARFNADGTRDETFGTSGATLVDGFSTTPFNVGMAIQADGKIVAVHTATSATSIIAVRLSADGLLDTTFGTGGKATFSQTTTLVANDVVVQNDGKIVVAGYRGLGTSSDFMAVRFLADGTADTSFDSDGIAVINLGTGSQDSAYRIALQNDGKIVLAGDSNFDFALVRLTTAGALDTTFDTDGKKVEVSTFGSTAFALALMADGRIVVGGTGGAGGNASAMARFHTNGSLDTSFGSGGFVNYDVGPDSDAINGIAIGAGGRITVVGRSSFTDSDVIVMKFLSDGTLNPSFGTAGVARFDLDRAATTWSSTLVQPDGRIVVAGISLTRQIIWRLETDGSLDPSFGTGRYYLPPGTGVSFTQVYLQADGKLLIHDASANKLTRLTADGVLDTTFGTGGARTYSGALFTSEIDLAFDSGGSIYVAGSRRNSVTGFDEFALAKFTAAGSLDASFDGDGQVLLDMADGNDRATKVTVDADGKILVGGTARVGSMDDMAVVRLNADGTLDTTFSGDGRMIMVTSTFDTLRDMFVQSDGRIVIAGSFGSGFSIVRLTSDGELDASFDGDGIAATGISAVANAEIFRQSDGKLLIAGGISLTTATQLFALRLQSDGSRDLSFDVDGLATFPLAAIAGSADMSAALQNDGKLLLTGQAATRDDQDLVVLRILTNDDLLVGAAPTIGAISNLQLSEDGAGAFEFTTADPDTRPEYLSFSIASSDTVVVNASSFAFTHLGGGVWRANITPTRDGVGTATVTLTVSDGTTSSSRTFNVTTTPVNDAPRFVIGPDVAAVPGVATIIPLWAAGISSGGFGELGQQFGFLVEVADPSLFLVPPSISASGQLAFFGQSTAAGKSTTVTVRLKDDGGTAGGGVDTSAPQTFTISFGRFPSIEAIADRTISEGATLAPIAVVLTDADSPISSLLVSGISENPEVVAGVTLINLGAGVWRLTASPTTDQYGAAVITLSVTDGVRTSTRSFTLNVTNVNDAPSFVKGEDQTIGAGAGVRTVPHWARSISAGAFETTQNLSFSLTVDDPTLFAVLPTISADGTLTYAAAPGKSGTANITVRLQDDGGTAGGGTETTAAQTFAIHVLAAAPGGATFDPTFDGDGIAAAVSPLAGAQSGTEVAVQADGKLIVLDGGFVRRFLADGALDTAFGVGGTAQLAFNGLAGVPREVQVSPDGKIYVAFSGKVARLNADGSPDSSYGHGGLAAATYLSLATFYGLTVQNDGKVVLVGIDAASTPAAARFLADGHIDTEFGTAGAVRLTGIFGRLNDVVVRPDGRIVAVGYGRPTSSTGNDELIVAQWTADGRLDTAFSEDGIALFGSTPNSDTGESIALDAEGRIVAFGNIGGAMGFVRLLADGTFDRSFGGGGLVTIPISSGSTAKEMVVTADGRIVAVGTLITGGRRDMFAVRLQADGSLDSSFDGDGQLTISVKAGSDYANAVALQADGKLVIVGSAQESINSGADLAMARVGADGSLDPTFGNGGLVTVATGPSTLQFRSIVRQPDGKYLATGLINQPSETSNIATYVVIRYLADGSLDASFGNGGYAVVTPSTSSGSTIAFQADGKILLTSASANDQAIVRLNADGSLDTSFGGDGSIDASFSPNALLVQADGKIVVAGQRSSGFAVARYNTDGTLDTTLAGTGDVVFNHPPIASERIRALAQQADGKLVLVGYSPFDKNYVVARINADGTLDTSFSFDGWTTTTVSTFEAEAVSVAIGTDGRITVGGTTNTGSLNQSGDWALVRYNADGSLDTGFGGDGIVQFAPGGGNDTFGELRLQADGKIVAVGSAVNPLAGGSTSTDTVIARFNADGTLDNTFDEDGVLLAPLSTGIDVAQGLTIDPDGRIVVVGYAEVNGRYEGRIIRLLGDLDASPPSVEGIFVRGSAWSADYLNHLDTLRQGPAELAGLGYALAAGASQTTVTVPWNNVNRVTLRFDRDVTVASADALVLYDSIGQKITASSFRYVDGRTVEWTVPILTTSKYRIEVDATKVAGVTGLALDGEWTTSINTWPQGSGNGTAGGDFQFRFNILAGDFDSSGSVAFGEIGQARLQIGKNTSAADFNYRQDFDGTGSITFGDFGQARGRLGTGLSFLAEPPVHPDEQATEALGAFAEFAPFQSFAPAPDAAATTTVHAVTNALPNTAESAAVSEFAGPPELAYAASPAIESFVVAPIFVEPAAAFRQIAVRQVPSVLGAMPPALNASKRVATRDAADTPILGDLARVRFERLSGESLVPTALPWRTPAGPTGGLPAISHATGFAEPVRSPFSLQGGESSPARSAKPWRRLEKRADSPPKDVFPPWADSFLDGPLGAD